MTRRGLLRAAAPNILWLNYCFDVLRFDGNFNTNVSKTICCDRLSPTVNSRAFNPGRDLNSGEQPPPAQGGLAKNGMKNDWFTEKTSQIVEVGPSY